MIGYHVTKSIPINHISIGHHQPQRPVPTSFPVLKRCEWLMSNRAPPHIALVGQQTRWSS